MCGCSLTLGEILYESIVVTQLMCHGFAARYIVLNDITLSYAWHINQLKNLIRRLHFGVVVQADAFVAALGAGASDMKRLALYSICVLPGEVILVNKDFLGLNGSQLVLYRDIVVKLGEVV